MAGVSRHTLVAVVVAQCLWSLAYALGDLPAHCLLQDVAGEWEVHMGPPVPSKVGLHATIPACGHHIPNNVIDAVKINASAEVPSSTSKTSRLTLTEDIVEDGPRRLRAFDGSGKEGAWTMVFDEGFEVKMAGNLSLFAHFFFKPLAAAIRKPMHGDTWTDIALYKGRRSEAMELEPKGDLYECHCDTTSVGWWHRKVGGSLESGCFWASKAGSKPAVSLVRRPQRSKPKLVALARARKVDLTSAGSGTEVLAALPEVMEDSLSTMQKEVWTSAGPSVPLRPPAKPASLLRRGGGVVASGEAAASDVRAMSLPKSVDWRHLLAGMGPPGTDVLGAQFSQGNCGSCYAFSGALVLQMRFRVQLLKKHGILYPLELSWKSATRCSPYTEGCSGGFAYLTFKYASEVGLPSAECDKAEAPEDLDKSCDWSCYTNTSELFYAKGYGFAGGFSHGANEQDIMREIHDNGPVILSFSTSAAPEFIYNNGQSWRNDTGVMTLFNNSETPGENFSTNPKINVWRYTTHSILAVGYGEEPTLHPGGETVKYWIVRNSWGQEWGAQGYGKMRRGFNDAALESNAPWVEPDLDRLPQGFLERARQYSEEQAVLRQKDGLQTPDSKRQGMRGKRAGGRPAYCKMRPDSIDCQ